MNTMWVIFVVLSAIIGANFASEFDLHINIPPGKDRIGKTALVPNLEGGFDEVDVKLAMNTPQPFFEVSTGVLFELYTRTNPTVPYLINVTDLSSLSRSPFNSAHPTRIAVHGWRSDGEIYRQLCDAYFNKTDGEYNFIAVNWMEGSGTLNYITARRRVDSIGEYLSAFVEFLIDFADLNIDSLVLIGHSLGAHIAGIAGKHMHNVTIPRIVGLDPASPLFSFDNRERRLATGDARYVEIVHSNAGLLGFSAPLGDASFYPNGGRSQPGCGWDLSKTCAHSRAYYYYAESIYSPSGFFAWQCESYEDVQNGRCHVKDPEQVVLLGSEYSKKNASGIYYLTTGESPLFALGMPKDNNYV